MATQERERNCNNRICAHSTSENIEIHCNALGGTIKFADLPEKIESFYRKESQLTGSLDPDNLLAVMWRLGQGNFRFTGEVFIEQLDKSR